MFMHLQNDKYSRIVCFRMLKLQKQKWNDMKKKIDTYFAMHLAFCRFPVDYYRSAEWEL